MSAWLLQGWSKRQLGRRDSIFFAAEGTDAGLVGSVRLSQSRVSRVYGAEDCAGARGELISTLAAACWVTVVGEHGRYPSIWVLPLSDPTIPRRMVCSAGSREPEAASAASHFCTFRKGNRSQSAHS